MSELPVNAELVGRRVCNPARPEWGVGTVLRVQATVIGGRPVQRVSVQFATGHRHLVVPPARLTAPQPERGREAGWLDQVAGRTPDDRLTELPAEVLECLGTPAQRIAALAPLYEHDEGPTSLTRWALRQARVADALTHWSRDELLVAFRRFCDARDSHLRRLAALLVQKEGREALRDVLVGFPGPIRAAMEAALRRPV